MRATSDRQHHLICCIWLSLDYQCIHDSRIHTWTSVPGHTAITELVVLWVSLHDTLIWKSYRVRYIGVPILSGLSGFEQLMGMFLSVSSALGRQKSSGNASERGLLELSIFSCDGSVKHYHRADSIVCAQGSTPGLTWIFLFHLEGIKISVPGLQIRN